MHVPLFLSLFSRLDETRLSGEVEVELLEDEWVMDLAALDSQLRYGFRSLQSETSGRKATPPRQGTANHLPFLQVRK